MWQRVSGHEIPPACEGGCSGLLEFTGWLGFSACSCWRGGKMTPAYFCGNFVLCLASPYLSSCRFPSCWHQPQLRLGHPTFPLRSGSTSPVACRREPGLLPGEDGGLGAAGRGTPWSEASPRVPPRNGNASLRVLAEPAEGASTPGLSKLAVSWRLALGPALENKCAWWGLCVCIGCSAPRDLPAPPVRCSAAPPEPHVQERPDISRGVSFLMFQGSGSCLTLMPSTSVVVSASTMWWRSQG